MSLPLTSAAVTTFPARLPSTRQPAAQHHQRPTAAADDQARLSRRGLFVRLERHGGIHAAGANQHRTDARERRLRHRPEILRRKYGIPVIGKREAALPATDLVKQLTAGDPDFFGVALDS